MAQAILLTGTISTTERAASGALSIRVQSDSATQHELTGTVTGEAAAIAALGARDRVLYWDLQVDLHGTGLVSLPAADFRILSIREQIEEWADTLEFELHGNKYSPLVQAAVRGLVPVTLYMSIGAPDAQITRQRFKGYATAVRWDHSRRVLSVTALDEAARHAEKIAAPSVLPEDEKARDSYAIEILQANSITVGQMKLGRNGKKRIKKPISQLDVRLLDWLRDYLAPCGAWIYFENGRLTAKVYEAAGVVHRELYPVDIVAIDGAITPPPSASTNTFTAVTVNYESSGGGELPTGYSTKTTTVRTYSTYAVQGAVVEQDVNGTQSSVSYSDASAALIETGRVVTVLTFRGDLMVRSEVTEWGYYAPQTARQEITDDLVGGNASIDPITGGGMVFYQYADGTWRRWPREKFIVTRRTVTSKTLDESGRVTSVDEDRYFWRFKEQALYQLDSPPGVLFLSGSIPGGAIPLTETGDGVYPRYEIFAGQTLPTSATSPDEKVVTTVELDSEGFITKQTEATYRYTKGARRSSTSDGAYQYGIDSPEYYQNENTSTLTKVIERSTQYDQISDESYIVTESLTEFGTLRTGANDVQVRTAAANGARPRPEQLSPSSSQQTSQELRSTAIDSVRVAMNGTIEDYLENEYCQDDEDLTVLADTALRESSAWPLSVTVPIEWVLHKGYYVTLNGFTDDGIDGLRCLVAGVTLNAESYTQQLDLRYYPPEVASIAN